MRPDNFMFFFDIFFGSKILSYLVEKLSKNKRHKKLRPLGFIISALILLAIHVAFFISQKQPNFFEILSLPRVFEPQELQMRVEFMKRTKQTSFYNNTIRLSEIKEILSNTPLKNSYDKFNKNKFDKREEMMSISQRFQVILYQKVFENSIYYLMMTAIIIISSDDENAKKSRKWVLGTMVAFFFIEMNYIFLNNNEKDLIDLIFPFMSIFERIQLQRDLLMPLLYIIKFSYQFFYRDQIYQMHKKLCKSAISQKGIRGAFENQYKKDECLELIQKNFEMTAELLTEYLKRTGQARKKQKEMMTQGVKSHDEAAKRKAVDASEPITSSNNPGKPENPKKSPEKQASGTTNPNLQKVFQPKQQLLSDKIKNLVTSFLILWGLYKLFTK